MTTYNKKCKGCGAILNNDKKAVGYVPKFDDKTTKYCYRCFRLINYNEINNDESTAKHIKKTIDEIDLSDKAVFLIVDILDIVGSLVKFNQPVKNLTIVVNKMDLLPKDVPLQQLYENVIDNINQTKIKYDNIIFCSAKFKSSIKKLDDAIKQVSKQKLKPIFIGKSNVGKSSLINSLIKLHGLDQKLTVSNLINTTIGLQKIKLDKTTIIDTPGFISEDNLLSIINYQTNKIHQNKYSIKPKTYQIKYAKQINIENLVFIQLEPNNQGSITFYFNNDFKINTSLIKSEFKMNKPNLISYIDQPNHLNDLKKYEYDLNKNIKSNITISGLGLISLKNIKKITIYINKKTFIKLLDHYIL